MSIVLKRIFVQVFIAAGGIVFAALFMWLLRIRYGIRRRKKRKSMQTECLTSIDTVEKLKNRFYYNPTEFEHYIAMTFEALGFEGVEVTAKTNDGGKDIIMYKGERKCIAEVKLYSPQYKIGREKIQKLHSAMLDSEAVNAIFVTTSDFTATAMAYAGKHEIDLINGFLLTRLIKAVEEGSSKNSADIIYLKDFIQNDLEGMRKEDIRKARRKAGILMGGYFIYGAGYIIATAGREKWYLVITLIICMAVYLRIMAQLILSATKKP